MREMIIFDTAKQTSQMKQKGESLDRQERERRDREEEYSIRLEGHKLGAWKSVKGMNKVEMFLKNVTEPLALLLCLCLRLLALKTRLIGTNRLDCDMECFLTIVPIEGAALEERSSDFLGERFALLSGNLTLILQVYFVTDKNPTSKKKKGIGMSTVVRIKKGEEERLHRDSYFKNETTTKE